MASFQCCRCPAALTICAINFFLFALALPLLSATGAVDGDPIAATTAAAAAAFAAAAAAAFAAATFAAFAAFAAQNSRGARRANRGWPGYSTPFLGPYLGDNQQLGIGSFKSPSLPDTTGERQCQSTCCSCGRGGLKTLILLPQGTNQPTNKEQSINVNQQQKNHHTTPNQRTTFGTARHLPRERKKKSTHTHITQNNAVS